MTPAEAKSAVAAALAAFPASEVARVARELDFETDPGAPSQRYADPDALLAAVTRGDPELKPAAREAVQAKGLLYLGSLAPERALGLALALASDKRWAFEVGRVLAASTADEALDALLEAGTQAGDAAGSVAACLGGSRHPNAGERVLAALLAAKADPAQQLRAFSLFMAIGQLRYLPARPLFERAALVDVPGYWAQFGNAVRERWDKALAAKDAPPTPPPPPIPTAPAREAPTPAAVASALDALAKSDVPVFDAIAHLVAELPRARLLELRVARARDEAYEARRIVAPFGSATMLEHFVAAPLALGGHHADALAARVEGLAVVPGYDPLLAAHVLTGAARDLSALGRHDEAAALARRAIRFLPGDPWALTALREAVAAMGNDAEAAAVSGYLRDAGYGPPVVVGPASAAEREAAPFPIDLEGLEPLSDEALARYVIYTRLDTGATDLVTQPVRHAANLLRRGDAGGARIGLDRCVDWEATNFHTWLGWFVNAVDWTALHALFALVDASPAGSAASVAARKKGPSRYATAHRTREEAVAELAAQGRADEIAPLLADWTFSVRIAAMAAIPDHPLARRITEIGEALGARIPGRSAGVVGPGGGEYVWVHGSHGNYTDAAGKRIEYPAVQGGKKDPASVPAAFAPLLERPTAGRATCRVCKDKCEAGELRLAIPKSTLKRDDKFIHARCATISSGARYRKDLEAALARDRRALPERAELDAALEATAPSKTKAKRRA